MIDLTIKELNKDDIWSANNNSMSGTRGDTSNHDYHVYAEKILSWNISDEKKRKLLDKLHDKWSEMLSHEARHVSVMVAGFSNYNAKKLDRSDKILKLSSDFCDWFDDLERQIEEANEDANRDADDAQYLVELAEPTMEVLGLTLS